MEELQECPACSGTLFATYLTCEDQLVSHKWFTIQQCNTCHLLFTNPRPSAKNIGDYYKSDTYISHDDTRTGLVDSLYRTVRRYTLNQKQKLISSLNGGIGAMLDYGCGTGAFLEQCQKSGWQVTGFEPDDDARRLAEQRIGRSVLKDVNDIRNQPKVDVITLWHVLEHVPDLRETLSLLANSLAEGGHLVIAVPNPISQDSKQFGVNWAAYDVPRHLYHFTPKVLTELIKTFGLKPIKRLPMPFDAFYIAMMSTKYRDGKTRYIESIVSGLRSNMAAAKSGDYSSLTYVFKK